MAQSHISTGLDSLTQAGEMLRQEGIVVIDYKSIQEACPGSARPERWAPGLRFGGIQIDFQMFEV